MVMQQVKAVPLAAVDNLRHRDEKDDCGDTNDNGIDKVAKKIRLPDEEESLVQSYMDPTDGISKTSKVLCSRTEINDTPSSPRRWWFSRHSPSSSLHIPPSSSRDSILDDSAKYETAKNTNHPTSSTMVLSEHLGRTSDVVESLTHDVKNWSLTRLSVDHLGGIDRNDVNAKAEKEKQCKMAQKRVRMARRLCLEERKQLLS